MALIGMYSWQTYAYNLDDDLVPVTWELFSQPMNAFVQVHLGDFYEFDDKSAAEVGIVKMVDSNQKKVEFPDPDWSGSSVRVAYQKAMTYMKVQMNVKNVGAHYIIQIFLS